MAITNPFSPRSQTDGKMNLPMPPPLLHTRSGNEPYERPSTPNANGFTSPVQTPQGSPSKKQFPPGANDLPNVFDNAMKLAPLSPTKSQPKSLDKPERADEKDPLQTRTANISDALRVLLANQTKKTLQAARSDTEETKIRQLSLDKNSIKQRRREGRHRTED